MSIETKIHATANKGRLINEDLNWKDWRWQQKNSITSIDGLLKYFPELEEDCINNVKGNTLGRKLSITPYTISLIKKDEHSKKPAVNDPIWHQLIPNWDSKIRIDNDYDGENENWELPEEMKTPICQHKYPNRVILRVSNICHAYCQFCYEALRTLDKKSRKKTVINAYWQDTVNYISGNEEVEEVILSGGEPLMLSNNKLDSMFDSLRTIDRDIAIRIHTRTLTFNPFRINEDLVDIIKRYGVNAIGLHVTHPVELSEEFKTGIRMLMKSCPILFANIPLLSGVNDNYETMKKLCTDLYRIGVIPHYLYHFMPFSPGLKIYRTDVRKGLKIIQRMKRYITNLAIPEYVLPHSSGKYTLPFELEASELPVFMNDDRNLPVVEFKNWKGERVQYSNMC